ncbi:hypothetical protein MNBD_CHLOROFLEXI01-5228 [hydrothermal vent metagenome]|uniref:Uncharacterized protein n=1 Tax=hydrothermal vent metagenome TaxID=652676 RepID=A0A3B0WGB4_9ZZZZ
MRHLIKSPAGFLLILWLTALACTIPGTGSEAPAATPTPDGDSTVFSNIPYTVSLESGDIVPGSQLQYVGKTGDLFNVKIDGVPTQKRTADSFFWSGIVAPGVFVNYNLRVAPDIFGPFTVAGPVEVTVLKPMPAPLNTNILPDWPDAIQYNNIGLLRNVPTGEVIAGTTLVFEGVSKQGEVESVQLSGLSGHPLFASGDSITWVGTLRDNVAIRYTFRVVSFSENSLQLAGTAELLVNP